MVEEIERFINDIYVLRDLKRYNNTLHIKDESVAEHCFFVARIVLELRKYYTFDLQKALIMALIHDDAEMYITDIPHNVKKRFPKLANMIKECENDVYKQDLLCFYDLYKELSTNSIEAKVVELADVLSCVQYSTSELKLGNTGYMKEVYENSIIRKNELLKDLEESLNTEKCNIPAWLNEYTTEK